MYVVFYEGSCIDSLLAWCTERFCPLIPLHWTMLPLQTQSPIVVAKTIIFVDIAWNKGLEFSMEVGNNFPILAAL